MHLSSRNSTRLAALLLLSSFASAACGGAAEGEGIDDGTGEPPPGGGADAFEALAGASDEMVPPAGAEVSTVAQSLTGAEAIAAKYIETGGKNGPLGVALSAVRNGANGGLVRDYQAGAIYWTAATGAQELHGDIYQKYKAWGQDAGFLGYPITSETRTPDGAGRFNYFQAGAIYWSPSTGARVVFGDIVFKWGQYGFETGFLGYPTSDSAVTPDGVGIFNNFQGGAVYWTQATGSQAIGGAIFQKWNALGRESGVLGYPMTEELVGANGGRFTDFTKGTIYWSPATGAREVHGFIRDRYWQLGAESGPLGYPTSDEANDPSFARMNTFQRGVIHWRFQATPFTVYQQNMGLLPVGYKGASRGASITALTNFLSSRRPDVVGLGEMFVDGDRDTVISRVGGIYPHRVDGPDENDVQEDGGLLLLSKFPLTQTTRSIYRTCFLQDCATNKGVLATRVTPPSGPAWDVALTHTQDPDAGGTGVSKPEVRAQLTHLRSVSHALRGNETVGALVMGDLNVDGMVPADLSGLYSRLAFPWDAWPIAGAPGVKGLTFDVMGDFDAGSTLIRQTDPIVAPRGQQGMRLDYLLFHDGQEFLPSIATHEIVNLQTSSGRDMSDHYGQVTTFDGSDRIKVDYTGSVSSVTVRLVRFHCLEVTDGALNNDDPDNMEWKLSVSRDGGAFTTKTSGLIDAGNDDVVTLGSPLSITTGAVSSDVLIRVEGAEVDRGPFGIETGRVRFGAFDMRLNKEKLAHAMIAANEYGFGVMEADDGEYTATVEVRATR